MTAFRRLILALSICGLNVCPVIAQVEAVSGRLESVELGSTKNVHRLDDLFLAGQFTQDDLETIKANGITRVITLRTDGEIDWDEEKLIKEAGIDFIKLPFRSPDSLNDEVFDKIRDLLKEQSGPTLFHCGSANRVAGIWLPFRVLDQGVELQQAVTEAEEIGLRTPFLKEKALDYIDRRKNKSDNPVGSDGSEKPGINASFLDPNLKVRDFQERFEVESREIYSAREEIVKACGIEPGQVIADVGSGTGLFTRMFSDRVSEQGWVFAVDIAPRLIEHVTRDAAEQNRRNITAVLCATDSINLPPASVDVVFVCDTYHHFEHPAESMASIYRALRDNGLLVVIDFERVAGVSRDWIMGHVRAGKEVFRAEIQDAGFALVDEIKIEGLKENYFLKFRKIGRQ